MSILNVVILDRYGDRTPSGKTSDHLLVFSVREGTTESEWTRFDRFGGLVHRWSFLGALNLPLDSNLDEALKLSAGWGHGVQGSTVMPGRGLAPERPWTESEREKLVTLAADEQTPGGPEPVPSLSKDLDSETWATSTPQSLALDSSLTLLGETCVDVYLNGKSHWSAVPIHVWNCTLGGYQVLNKWLSYREFTPEPASPLLHRALHLEEAAYFAQGRPPHSRHFPVGPSPRRQLQSNPPHRHRPPHSLRPALTEPPAPAHSSIDRLDVLLRSHSGRPPVRVFSRAFAEYYPRMAHNHLGSFFKPPQSEAKPKKLELRTMNREL